MAPVARTDGFIESALDHSEGLYCDCFYFLIRGAFGNT